MKKSIFVLSLFFLTVFAFTDEVKPLYRLPEKTAVSSQNVESENDIFLVGSDNGLFRVTNRNSAIPLWTEGRVDQLVNLQNGWLMRTAKGIFYTQDLKNFEERDTNLPFLTIKSFKDGKTTLSLQIQELKDISINPVNNNEIVTATKDSVFFSRDCGKTWRNLGSMSKTTPGVKAVAVATLEGQTVVFMAHPIFGLSYIMPDAERPEW